MGAMVPISHPGSHGAGRVDRQPGVLQVGHCGWHQRYGFDGSRDGLGSTRLGIIGE